VGQVTDHQDSGLVAARMAGWPTHNGCCAGGDGADDDNLWVVVGLCCIVGHGLREGGLGHDEGTVVIQELGMQE
jgi:hypothetical protein